mmetsp:Transcript_18720/g.37757  ORF Transcript_18720/g.37757 Transcript_18720/m.37757 type:complete len:558 (+) Transcript_18720:46-1719(+)
MNDNKSTNPTKKRKASDGRATVDGSHNVNTSNTNDGGSFLSSWFGYFSGQRDDASSGPPRNEQLIQQSLSKMDKMEQIMIRMEEKLATVSSLESRCEQLEAKCSSLENILESTSQSTKGHMNRLETKVDSVHVKLDRSLNFHEYNEMLVKNQVWGYSADIDTADNLVSNGYTDDEAEYVAETSEELRDITLQLRRGVFPEDSNQFDSEAEGISMEMPHDDPIFSEAANDELLPHWKEFAAALKQFTPAMNLLSDNCERFFTLSFVQLDHEAMLLIKDALIGKPFRTLSFTNNDNGEDDPAGMSVDAIVDIVESNKHLRKLEIGRNRIGRDHIERLCSAVRTHALVELDLSNCFEPGNGDAMLTSLLTSGGLKLEKLVMFSNNITSAVSTVLADFLASNPRLKELDLEEDNLNDSDVALIANALRSNTTLRTLRLIENNITKVGKESLRLVLYDESSLNAVADSNHICTVDLGWKAFDVYNSHEQGQINRCRKIYSLLSSRNETMSNVQHFGNIDLKILPIMLEAVQKYAKNVNFLEVKPLSIVYEVMRKWGVGNFET